MANFKIRGSQNSGRYVASQPKNKNIDSMIMNQRANIVVDASNSIKAFSSTTQNWLESQSVSVNTIDPEGEQGSRYDKIRARRQQFNQEYKLHLENSGSQGFRPFIGQQDSLSTENYRFSNIQTPRDQIIQSTNRNSLRKTFLSPALVPFGTEQSSSVKYKEKKGIEQAPLYTSRVPKVIAKSLAMRRSSNTSKPQQRRHISNQTQDLLSIRLPSQGHNTIEDFNILQLSTRNMFGSTEGNWALSHRNHKAAATHRPAADKQSMATARINTDGHAELASTYLENDFQSILSQPSKKTESPRTQGSKAQELLTQPFPLQMEDDEEAIIVNYRLKKRKRQADIRVQDQKDTQSQEQQKYTAKIKKFNTLLAFGKSDIEMIEQDNMKKSEPLDLNWEKVAKLKFNEVDQDTFNKTLQDFSQINEQEFEIDENLDTYEEGKVASDDHLELDSSDQEDQHHQEEFASAIKISTPPNQKIPHTAINNSRRPSKSNPQIMPLAQQQKKKHNFSTQKIPDQKMYETTHPVNPIINSQNSGLVSGPNIAETEFSKTLETWLPRDMKALDQSIKGWLAGFTKSGSDQRKEQEEADSEIKTIVDTDIASKDSSTIQNQPYGHLRAVNVFKFKSVQFYKEMRALEKIEDSYVRLPKLVELNKQFLTYMDKKKGFAERMPFELFTNEAKQEQDMLIEQVKTRNEQGRPPLKALTFFNHLDGSVEKIEVSVIGFDTKVKKFLVSYKLPKDCLSSKQGEDNEVKKLTARLNLTFLDYDDEAELRARYNQAQLRRKCSLISLAVERIILNELIFKYKDIQMPDKVKLGVVKLVSQRMNLDTYKDQEALRHLIMQVESQYVYASLYSVIKSQKNDLYIQKLMAKYGIKSIVEPDVDNNGTMFPRYEMQNRSEKRSKQFKSAMKLILTNTVPGNASFLECMKFVMEKSYEIFQSYPLFDVPSELTEETLTYLISQNEFSKVTKDQLQKDLTQFPVQMDYILDTQKLIASRFKGLLVSKWAYKIAFVIEKMISDSKKGAKSLNTVSNVSQIPDSLLRFFKQINTYMERQIFDKMKESMRNYMKFLLQFTMRFEYFTQSPKFTELGLDSVLAKPETVSLTNIKVKISKASSTNTQQQQDFIIATQPDVSKLWSKFGDLVKLFQSSLSGIKKIEKLVYPLLKFEKVDPCLTTPKPDQIQDLKLFNEQINWLIEHAKIQPASVLQTLETFMPIISTSYESMIEGMKLEHWQSIIGQVRKSQQEKVNQDFFQECDSHDNSEDDLDELQSESNSSEQVDPHLKVKLTDDCYAKKLKELNHAFWAIQTDVQDEYDFGLVQMDCRAAKDKICSKIDSLRRKLAQELISEFLVKMKSLYEEFAQIEQKIEKQAETVDEAIQQIEYIKQLLTNEEILDDLDSQFGSIRLRKKFLDQQALKIPSEDFNKFLQLFIYSTDIKRQIRFKNQNVAQEKKKIQEMLEEDVIEIQKIAKKGHEETMLFKITGLQTFEELEATITKDCPKEVMRLYKELLQRPAENQNDPFINYSYVLGKYQELEIIRQDFESIDEKIAKLHQRQNQLNLEPTVFKQYKQTVDDLMKFKLIWHMAVQYSKIRKIWWTGRLHAINSDEMFRNVTEWDKSTKELMRMDIIKLNKKPEEILLYIKSELETVREYLPVIVALKTKGLDRRHLKQINEELKMVLDPQNMTLADLKENNLTQGSAFELIRNIAEVAGKENSIKVALDSIDTDVQEIYFELAPYKETETIIIKQSDETLQNLEECLIRAQAMKGHQFAKHHAERVSKTEKELQSIISIFTEWTRVQRQWIYLEPIFSQQDVRNSLEQQCEVFDRVDKQFKTIMKRTDEHTTCQEFVKYDGFVLMCQEMILDLENLDKSLSEYLDKKRNQVSRLYFTSNEELIEWMGQMKNPKYLEVFMAKLFEGLEGLQFKTSTLIGGCTSKTGEVITLDNPISTKSSPESWLKQFETEVKRTMYTSINNSAKDYEVSKNEDLLGWIQKWPGQVIIVVLHILTKYKMDKVFNPKKPDYSLVSFFKEILSEIEFLATLVNKKLEKNSRITVNNMMINRIQIRDSINQMMKDRIEQAEEFYWVIQMKYHYMFHKHDWERRQRIKAEELKKRRPQANDPNARSNKVNGLPEDWDCSKVFQRDWVDKSISGSGMFELSVSCINARIAYGYEYQGNTNRLVITPLTDKCFRTIFMAMHYGYGAAPEGPVGTGKTETTKELAKSVAKMCFVFNCSSSLDFDSLLKFFKGFASGGGWSCFDEFNRIEMSVLSVISQIIITVNTASREKQKKICLDGETSLPFDSSCCIFITMNPFHQGRSKLPDNLKAQFRPVQMILPDLRVITEVILYCNGFQFSNQLSEKLVKLFEFAKMQLGSREHYDFGLRAVKIIVEKAGRLKLQAAGVINLEQDKGDSIDSKIEEHLKALEQKRLSQYLLKQQKQAEEEEKKAQQKRKKTSKNLLKNIGSNPQSSSLSLKPFTMDVGQTQKNVIEQIKEEDPKQAELEREKQNQSLGDKFKRAMKINVEKHEEKINKQTDKIEKKLERFIMGKALSSKKNTVPQELIEEVNENIQSNKQSNKSIEEEGPQNEQQQQEWERYQKILDVKSYSQVNTDEKLEEYIVVKAIFDQNLSKLQAEDTMVFKGITEDIFTKTRVDATPGGQFKQDVLKTFQRYGLHPYKDYLTAILNLDETIKNRHGVMIIGDTMAGKTSTLKILQATYNQKQKEEFKMKQRQFIQKKFYAKEGNDVDPGFDRQDFFERYPGCQINLEESNLVKQSCKYQGIAQYIVNPKAQSYERLMGQVDPITLEWKDGIFPKVMRLAQKNKTNKRQWIVLDGSLEAEWVENLNSVLDDNKKLTLVTGECIPLDSNSTIIIEGSDLKYCSPATVSRCGIMCMADKLVNVKAIFNHYINNLPPILSEYAEKFDRFVMYFFPDILELYLSHEHMMLYPITNKHAAQNFLKYFEACIFDYRDELFRDWKKIQEHQKQMIQMADSDGLPPYSEKIDLKLGHGRIRLTSDDRKIQDSLKYRELWFEAFFIQSLIHSFSTILKKDHRVHFAEHVYNKIVMKQDLDTFFRQSPDKSPASPNKSPARTKNVSQFGSPKSSPGRPGTVLSSKQNMSFEEMSHIPYIISETKFKKLVSGQQKYVPTDNLPEKRKPLRERRSTADMSLNDSIENIFSSQKSSSIALENLQSSKGFDKQKPSVLSFNVNTEQSKYQRSESEKSLEVRKSKSKLVKEASEKSAAKSDGEEVDKILDFKKGDDFEIQFKCQLPDGGPDSLLSVYYDVDNCRWVQWKTLQQFHAESMNQHGVAKLGPGCDPSTRDHLFNIFIPTDETTQITYLAQQSVFAGQSVAFAGEVGSGKSWLVKNFLNERLPKLAQNLIIKQSIVYSQSNAQTVQKAIENPLEKKRKGLWGPPYGKKVAYFFDDISLGQKDKYNESGLIELLRQWFDHNQWYDARSSEIKQVDDISFLSCVTCNPATPRHLLGQRTERHLKFIGVPCSQSHLQQIFKFITSKFVQGWQGKLSKIENQIFEATYYLRDDYNKLVKSSANRFMYMFNLKHMFRILHGVSCIKASEINMKFDVAKVWASEAYRTLVDKVDDKEERRIFNGVIQDNAFKSFKLDRRRDVFQSKMGRPFYSHIGDDSPKCQSIEVEKIRFLKPKLESVLIDFNMKNKFKQISMSLFDYMLEMIMKVTRAIKQPYSSVILISVQGLGKAAISALSIHINKFDRGELLHGSEFNEESWKQSLVRMISVATMNNQTNVINIQENQLPEDADVVLIDLNCLLKNGEIPDLLAREELAYHLAGVKTSLSGTVHEILPEHLLLQEYYCRVRRNMKTILNLTPNGRILCKELRKYQSLVNQCTIIWMDPWPEEGYKDVGNATLDIKNLNNKNDIVKQAIKMHKGMERAIEEYRKETDHALHLTPCNFKNLILSFKKIYKIRLKNLDDTQGKYRSGLSQLAIAEEKILRVEDSLSSDGPLLNKESEEAEVLKVKVDKFQEEIEAKQSTIDEIEAKIKRIEGRLDANKLEIEEALSQVEPDYLKQLGALQRLTKSQTSELKVMKKPPFEIQVLMTAICILFKVTPKRTKIDGKFVDDYWSAAVSKSMLGSPDFTSKLIKVDHNSLDNSIMVEVEKAFEVEEFNFLKMKKSNKASVSIYQWLMALIQYHKVYFSKEGLRESMRSDEKEYIELQADLEQRNLSLYDFKQKVSVLMQEYAAKDAKISHLRDELEKCNTIRRKANKLLDALGGEKQKWRVANRVLDTRFETLEGDCLLGAGVMIYLAQFTNKFRAKFLQKWLDSLEDTSNLKFTLNFDFVALFADKIKVKEWVINNLPNDNFAITNAIIIEQSPVQSIIIDPQYQATNWIKMQNSPSKKCKDQSDPVIMSGANDINQLNFDHPKFITQISACIKFGRMCLIENVGEKIDRNLYPLFNHDLLLDKEGGKCIPFKTEDVQIDPSFKLYLVTELKNPIFAPDVAVYANFINFSVTKEGLEQQLLNVVLNDRATDLQSQYKSSLARAHEHIVDLKEVEEKILSAIQNDIDVVLDDESLIENLGISHQTSKKVAKALQEVNSTQEELNKARAIYQPVAIRAAMLFFVIKDLNRIEYVYQFSLKWFMEIFEAELKSDEEPDRSLPPVDPVIDLNDRLTQQVYQKICLSVFQKDKLLISFLIANAFIKTEINLDSTLLKFFIQGPYKIQNTQELTQREKDEIKFREENTGQKVDQKQVQMMKLFPQVDNKIWKGLQRLCSLPPFNKPNLIDQILSNFAEWDVFINKSDDVEQPIIPGSYAQFDFREAKQQEKEAKKQAKDQQLAENSIGKVSMVNEDDIFAADESDHEAKNGSPSQHKKSHKSGSLKQISNSQDQNKQSNIQSKSNSRATSQHGSDDEQDNDIQLGSEVYDALLKQKYERLKHQLLRCCILRVFRPDLLIQAIKDFIKIALGDSFANPPEFQFGDLLRNTTFDTPCFLILSENVDTHQEMQTMRKILKKDTMALHQIPLGDTTLKKLPHILTLAAQSGHWVLLDNLHLVPKAISSIQKFLRQMFLYEEDLKQQELKALLKAKQKKQGLIESTESQESDENDEEQMADQNAENKQEQKQDAKSQPKVEPENNQTQSKDPNEMIMPEIQDFRIQQTFRLWISTQPMPQLPMGWIQECQKVVLEPVNGMRLNVIKTLNSTPPDFWKASAGQDLLIPFRQLYFALTFFHSLMCGRDRFQSLGWSRAYTFSPADHRISSLQILSLIRLCDVDGTAEDRVNRIPLRLLNYIISQLNYGGQVSRFHDNRVSLDLIQVILNEQTMIKGSNLNLAGLSEQELELEINANLEKYVMPTPGSLDHYSRHMSTLPDVDMPEVFGLHQNAQATLMQQEAENVLQASMKLVQNVMKDGNEFDIKDSAAQFRRQKTKLIDIEANLPDLLDTKVLAEIFPLNQSDCINLLINAEVSKYNNLVTFLKDQVSILQSCLDGETIYEPALERAMTCILVDETPADWLIKSFPSSQSLPTYLGNLQERVDYMNELMDQQQQNGELKAFWLPGLFDQAHFFAALVQQQARNLNRPLDSLSISYTVSDSTILSQNKQEAADQQKIFNQMIIKSQQDKDFWLIYGLQIHGAHWSSKEKCLQDTPRHHSGLIQTLPALILRVVEKEKIEIEQIRVPMSSKRDRGHGLQEPDKSKARDAAELLTLLKTVATTASDPAVSLPVELQDTAGKRYHMAPLYVTKLRDRGKQGALPSLCGEIPLRVDDQLTRTMCVKRGIALFCHDLD